MYGVVGPRVPLEWVMPYEYQEFPCWVTHESGKQQVVQSEEQFKALGDGWKKPAHAKPKVHIDSESFQHYPKWVGGKIVNSAEEEAALTPAEPEKEPEAEKSDERAILIQIADEKGIHIDKRWSADKIRAALEAA